MDRDALDALEKRVAALRVLTAEKAVLARTLGDPEPVRYHAEIATAILAVAVLVVFLAGREIGMFAARDAPCSPLAQDEFVSVTFATDSYVVTVNTNGRIMRDPSAEGSPPGRLRHVRPDAARAVVNRLVTGCFLEKQPPHAVVDDVRRVTLTVYARGRITTYRHERSVPIRMCGGDDDLSAIERAIVDLADHAAG